jgi:hypothetical protein
VHVEGLSCYTNYYQDLLASDEATYRQFLDTLTGPNLRSIETAAQAKDIVADINEQDSMSFANGWLEENTTAVRMQEYIQKFVNMVEVCSDQICNTDVPDICIETLLHITRSLSKVSERCTTSEAR